jgi:hypothetical protein
MVLCAYYKAGHCDKGNKCKFSHDLNVGRKVEKKDLYSDTREDKMKGRNARGHDEGVKTNNEPPAADTMDKWDEDKLRSVVSAKGNPRTTTDIVCKYFIEAIETQKYGWFWECPNGGDSS